MLEAHFRQIMDVVNALRPAMTLQDVMKDAEDETKIWATHRQNPASHHLSILPSSCTACASEGINQGNVQALLGAVKVASDAMKQILFFALVFEEQATLQTVYRVFLPTYFEDGICRTDVVALCHHPIVTLAGFKSHDGVRRIAYHYECLYHALGSCAEPTQFAYQRVFDFLRPRGIIRDMPVAEEGAVTTATDADLIAHFYALLFDAEHAICLLTTNPARFAELVAFVCKAHRLTTFDQMYTKILHLVLFGEHDRAWCQIAVGLLQPLLELAKADELAGVKQDGWSVVLHPRRGATRPSLVLITRMLEAGSGKFELDFMKAMRRPLVGCMFNRPATPEEREVYIELHRKLHERERDLLHLTNNPLGSHGRFCDTQRSR